MKFRILCSATLVFVLVTPWAMAQNGLRGRWRDNAPAADPVGTLTIEAASIVLGRRATYHVRAAGPFGSGELFEVVGVNRKRDPEGCGPEGKVRFLAVERLPAVVSGSPGAAIRVFFYSGSASPTPSSIENDIALCSVHPFGR